MTGSAGRTVARAQRSRAVGTAPDTTLWAVLAVALTTVLGLQAVRVFVSDTVFVVDQSRRTLLAVLMGAAFASPLLAPLVSALTRGRLLQLAAILLVVARLGLQFVEWPLGRIVLGALGLAASGWLLIPLLRWRARAGLGIVVGMALDLAIRLARGTVDLPWMPGLGSHLVTGLLLAVFLATVFLVATDRGPLEPRGAVGLAALGPAFGLAHLVVTNPGFAVVHAERSLVGAGVVLALALLAGIVLSPLVVRHWSGWIGATVLGGAGFWLAWGSGWLATLGILLAGAGWTLLTAIAAIGGRVQRTPASTARAALALAVGQLIQVGLLFRYFTATGDRTIVLALWIVLALITALEWPRGWPAGTTALLPHVTLAALVPLAGATLWQAVDTRVRPPATMLGADLVVMTYNIQSGYDRSQRWNLEATAQVIEAAQPDIVLLQEVSRGWLVTVSADQLTWLARRLGMQASWGPASRDGLWGNAILTRGQPLETRVIQFRQTQNLRRSAVAVRVGTTQSTIWAVSTHLDNPREATAARLDQLEELLAFAAPLRPLVLGSDLNADPESAEIAQLLAHGYRDAAADIGAVAPTSADGRRIDYLFVSEPLRVLSGRVPTATASDHRPVVIRIALE